MIGRLHQIFGVLALFSPALAALLYGLAGRRAALAAWAERAGLAARALLLAQVGLGLVLVSQGALGRPAHQLGGLAALALSLLSPVGAATEAGRRRAWRGYGLAAACALAAYLLAHA
jgi:hypothetical protein